MTQEERIEKTTKIFEKAKTHSSFIVLNEAQDVIVDYFNEHLSAISRLEMPFFIFNMERRLQLYKDDLKQDLELMFLYNILKASAKKEDVRIIEMPNAFNTKDGKKDD